MSYTQTVCTTTDMTYSGKRPQSSQLDTVCSNRRGSELTALQIQKWRWWLRVIKPTAPYRLKIHFRNTSSVQMWMVQGMAELVWLSRTSPSSALVSEHDCIQIYPCKRREIRQTHTKNVHTMSQKV